MLDERDRQAKLAETAMLHLRPARHELCRLRDALDRERRRRPGLSLAAALVLALAAFAGGFGLGVTPEPDGPAVAGELGSCVIRPELLRQPPQP